MEMPIITNKGLALLTKVSNNTLNLSYIALGSGENLIEESIESLKNEEIRTKVEYVQYKGTKMEVRATFSNEDIEKGFYVTEIGLYAIDPNEGEILYAYTCVKGADADYFTPKSNSLSVNEVIQIIIGYGNASKVNLIVDNKLVYMTAEDYGIISKRVEAVDSQLQQKALQIDLNTTNAVVALKADKSEVTNVMTPKGNIAYASLPTTGDVGWYYYCPDGDSTNGAGNYVWNGTSWYFGGTGDEGYSFLKKDLVNKVDLNGYKKVTKKNSEFFKIGRNKFNGVLHTGYMNKKGVIDSTNVTYAYTDRIYTEGNTSIILSALGSDGTSRVDRTARFVTAFDINGDIVENLGQENVGLGMVPITLDERIDSIVLTVFVNTPLNEFMVQFGNTVSAYEGYYQKIDMADINYSVYKTSGLYGKILMTFGDSIVAGDGNKGVGIGDLIANKYNMTLHDYSLGGATIGVIGTNNIFDQINSGIASGIVPDVIILDGLTNDITNIGGDTSISTDPKVAIGNLVSSMFSVETLADKTSFSGSLELSFEKLLEAFPKTLIIYVRPHQMGSRNLDLQEVYGERAIEICKRWGVHYVDLYNVYQSRFPATLRTTFLTDYTHPNADGYKYKYLPLIESKMRECFYKL